MTQLYSLWALKLQCIIQNMLDNFEAILQMRTEMVMKEKSFRNVRIRIPQDDFVRYILLLVPYNS